MSKRAQRPKPTPERAQRLAALGRVPREVFELLAESETPLKAYELLWRLQAMRGRPAPPTTIYRATAALIEAGLVHRIASLGAFVVCTGSDGEHQPLFLICDACRRATEINAAATKRLVAEALEPSGFRATDLNFIVRGLCRACQKEITTGGHAKP